MRKKTLRAVSVFVVMVFLVLAVFSLSACSSKKNIIGTFYGIGYNFDGKITECVIKFIDKTDLWAYTHISGNSPVIQTGTYWISENKVMLDVFNDGEITFEYDKKANSLSTETADIVLNKLSKGKAEIKELEIITQINTLFASDDSLKKSPVQMKFEQAEKVKIIESALLKGTIVAVNPLSVYVKVPLSDELLALSKQEPDAWFQSGEDGLNYISSDKNSTLIEITSTDYRLLAYGIDKLTIDNAIQNNSQLGWYCIGIDRA